MVDSILLWLASLGLDWGVLLGAGAVLVLVYLLALSGIAKTGDAKRFLGAVVALVVAKLQAEAVGLPGEFSEVAVLGVNWLINWLGAALAHYGIEVIRGDA